MQSQGYYPSYSDAGDESVFFISYSEGTTTYLYQQLFCLKQNIVYRFFATQAPAKPI